ncbi:hypothetical protein ES703_35817 [subsurface metagenome]
MVEGALDGFLGYLVEDDAAVGLAVGLGHLFQVPGDSLPLAVGVGGKIDGGGSLNRLFKLVYDLGFGSGHHVLRGKTLLQVYPQLAPGQVSHMPHRGLEAIAVAQQLAQRSCLGRRLNYNQLLFD